MKPYLHAMVSVRKWGGRPEDYLPVHDFLDSSKAHLPDVRHRALLHNSFGIYIAERVFGHNITNANGKLVSVLRLPVLPVALATLATTPCLPCSAITPK